ncbi:hypothetical protein GCM10022377_24840 [Zhihengliuella alba]|uniref:Uncharacterized protein n=1 Tax=Zhihengliuella alba TaxID=547018 RepID=A0ABP7DWZ9_9MICC
MPEQPLHEFLAAAAIDPAVHALRPDYRALLLAADGLEPGGDAGGAVDELVAAAEAHARALLAELGSSVAVRRRLVGAP